MSRQPLPPVPPPPIPGQQQQAPGGGGQLQQLPSDWAATTGVTRILNKPDLSLIQGDISSAEFEALIKVAFQIRSNPFARNFVDFLSSAAGEAKLFVGQTAKFGATQYLAIDKDNHGHTIDLIKPVDVIYIERGTQRLMARVAGVEDDSGNSNIRKIWLLANLYEDNLGSGGTIGAGAGTIYPLPIFTSLSQIPVVGQVFQANWASDASANTPGASGWQALGSTRTKLDANVTNTPALSSVRWLRLNKISASDTDINTDGDNKARFIELCNPGGNIWLTELSTGVTPGTSYFIFTITGQSQISSDGSFWDIPVAFAGNSSGAFNLAKNYLFRINPRREQILGANIITDINASMIDTSQNAGSLGELDSTNYLLGSDSSNKVKSASLDDLNASILPYALTQITLTGYKYYRQGSGNANRNSAGSVFRINLNQFQIVPKAGDEQKLNETAFSPGHVMVFWVSASQNVRVLVQSAGVLAGRKYFNFAQTIGIEITGTEPADDTTIEIRGQSPHIAYSDISQTLNNSLFNVPSTHALDGKTLPSGGSAGQLLKKTATGFAWGDDSSLDPEDQVPFAAAFRDVFTRTFVAALTATHGEAIVSNNNTKPSGAPDGTTDFVGVDRRTAANLDQNTQLSAISAGDWIRAKVGSNFIVAKIQHVEYNSTEFAFYFWFNPSTDIADTLSYDQLGTGSGEIRFYTKSSGSGQSLTDSQIGDKAFSNPPSDLTNTEKSAVRTAIGVTVGGSNNFDLHDDVTTEIDTIADADRFVISDESASGDPNKYVQFSSIKTAIGSGGIFSLSGNKIQIDITGTKHTVGNYYDNLGLGKRIAWKLPKIGGEFIKSLDAPTGTSEIRGFTKSSTRLYLGDRTTNKIYVYNRQTLARVASEDITLASGNTKLNSLLVNLDETKILCMDAASTPKIYVYQLSDGSHLSSEDWNLDTANNDPTSMYGNTTRIFISQWQSSTIYAYSWTGTYHSSDNYTVAITDLQQPGGMDTDGTYVYASDIDDEKVYIWDASTHADTGITLYPSSGETGYFETPRGVAVFDDIIAVTDTTTAKIMFFKNPMV